MLNIVRNIIFFYQNPNKNRKNYIAKSIYHNFPKFTLTDKHFTPRLFLTALLPPYYVVIPIFQDSQQQPRPPTIFSVEEESFYTTDNSHVLHQPIDPNTLDEKHVYNYTTL